MNTWRKNKVLQIVTLFLAITLVVVVLDTLIGEGKFYNGSFEFNAAFNDFADTLWFSEAASFVVTGVLLVVFLRRRFGRLILPWILAAIVTILFVGTHFVSAHCEYGMNPSTGKCWGPTLYETAHWMPQTNAGDGHDYMLESLWWEFLQYQSVFIIGLGSGYAWLLLQKKHSVRS